MPAIATASFGATKPDSKSNADNHITHLPAILTKPATISKTTSTGLPLVTIFRSNESKNVYTLSIS
jgi:hypothetical protein